MFQVSQPIIIRMTVIIEHCSAVGQLRGEFLWLSLERQIQIQQWDCCPDLSPKIFSMLFVSSNTFIASKDRGCYMLYRQQSPFRQICDIGLNK